jgi:hypothetical protein
MYKSDNGFRPRWRWRDRFKSNVMKDGYKNLRNLCWKSLIKFVRKAIWSRSREVFLRFDSLIKFIRGDRGIKSSYRRGRKFGNIG